MQTQGIKAFIRNKISTPNKDATLLFGFNKSGTTVTINLLAHATKKSFSHDSRFLQEPYFSKVREGEISLTKHANTYSEPFSKNILRYPIDPSYTQYVWTYFNQNKFVLTIRNPFDNIRSILNRLKLPGDKNDIDFSQYNLHPNWVKMLSLSDNYIESLAEAWRRAYNQDLLVKSPNVIISKYEDFIQNKVGHIERLATALDFPVREDIGHLVDKQFQPKGNPNTDVLKFFGEQNVSKIGSIVKDTMALYNYEL